MPWDCDNTEHFTVAAYFERFGDANLALMEHAEMGADYRAKERKAIAAVECYVRYNDELRSGDAFDIEGGIIGVEDKIVSVGHKVRNSANGEVTATLEQKTLHFDMEKRKAVSIDDVNRARLESVLVEWDGPKREERHFPDGMEGYIPTCRDTVKPWELDVLGHMTFHCHIQRFSTATMHAATAMGLTPAYARENRGGISTFEMDVRYLREFDAGDLLSVKSALVHLGKSSFRFVHKMFNERTGVLSAVMSQYGVYLDLDARRPAPLPDGIREKAKSFLVA